MELLVAIGFMIGAAYVFCFMPVVALASVGIYCFKRYICGNKDATCDEGSIFFVVLMACIVAFGLVVIAIGKLLSLLFSLF